ncbi:hypothetical protein ARAM_005097 [Aspergillus rambellii]|uniref:Protein kinase domain-containing protein n=2 Tax=Aspergillus subgen. Nidulantes TaxID=2720870 RepID=A0A0F8XBM7_9EURO|nr:hypothetical protein ARAM_005097 [Aspergillus rambellii]KKK22248.1 hypothetical protein AOCH_001984 [Aspergillus ochraceoroseus]
MKYPLAPGGDMSRLEIEKKLFEIVGPHERIRAVNGTLADYILESDHPPPSIQQRLSWCREATEAVAWVHARGVLTRTLTMLEV